MREGEGEKGQRERDGAERERERNKNKTNSKFPAQAFVQAPVEAAPPARRALLAGLLSLPFAPLSAQAPRDPA